MRQPQPLLADIGLPEEELPVQISDIDLVQINHVNVSESTQCKVFKDLTPQPSPAPITCTFAASVSMPLRSGQGSKLSDAKSLLRIKALLACFNSLLGLLKICLIEGNYNK
jgi:hypothetical protein